MSASRVSSGSGDLVQLEIYAENGAFRYSSQHSEYYEYYIEGSNQWIKQIIGSNYNPVTSFPSGHVPPGWLRSMVHAHYQFFTGDDDESVVADLKHGLARITSYNVCYTKLLREYIYDFQSKYSSRNY